MRESLPGNPTDAGPLATTQPPAEWDELMMEAEDEIKLSRHLRRVANKHDIRLQREAILRAQNLLTQADEALKALEAIRG